MKTNVKSERSHVFADAQLAGGMGAVAAKQTELATLRRLVLTCLLWEDNAYSDGVSTVEAIRGLVPMVAPEDVARLAVEARFHQKLRHVPLLLAREMARHQTHRKHVRRVLAQIIHRPDELAEFLALYWADNVRPGTTTKTKALATAVKRGLADAFTKFDAYQLGKWNKTGRAIKLRDVLFLCHAKPRDAVQDTLWKQLIADTLPIPDTWEVRLSAAKSEADKKVAWEELLTNGKLPAFAFLKNLRNMTQVGVDRGVLAEAFATIKSAMLLPVDFFKAAAHTPDWIPKIEQFMFRCAADYPKLPGWTMLVIDVSGSMSRALSERSEHTRLYAAASMAVLAAEVCEHVSIYATAGNDHARTHSTAKIPVLRGFGLAKEIIRSAQLLGGGGIFTRQCLEAIRAVEKGDTDRIIVFSDSQDCDLPDRKTPKPFGKYNYICDVSPHRYGVNYHGLWTAEVAGWSENFLRFVASCEQPLN